MLCGIAAASDEDVRFSTESTGEILKIFKASWK